MRDYSNKYRELLVQKIQALSYDLNNMAADLVGTSDLITNFEIRLKFPPDAVPTIEVVREHIAEQAMYVQLRKEE